MRRLAILVVVLGLLAAGCTGGRTSEEDEEDFIYVWHDDERNVTCWVRSWSYRAGLSCWPDHLLEE